MRERHGHGSQRLGLSPTYHSWKAMRRRCNNPNYKNYKYYGGKGVTVCERWDSFPLFLKDMGERPEGKTLDRIEGDGDYKPSNCKWSTKREQMLNRKGLNDIHGVSFEQASQKWKAWGIRENNKRPYLGSYKDKGDAIAARKQWEKENLT